MNPDTNTNVRHAFYLAVVRRMTDEGCTADEIIAELQVLTGNPVRVTLSSDGGHEYHLNIGED